MVETLSPYRADKALAVRILPGRPWRTDDLFDAHVPHAMLKHVAVNTIAITNQKTWRSIIGKRFNDLLSRPLGCRMRRYVEMDNVSAVVTQYHKSEKYAKRRCRDGEEVDGDDVDQMIVEKGAPSL